METKWVMNIWNKLMIFWIEINKEKYLWEKLKRVHIENLGKLLICILQLSVLKFMYLQVGKPNWKMILKMRNIKWGKLKLIWRRNLKMKQTEECRQKRLMRNLKRNCLNKNCRIQKLNKNFHQELIN